ncbi:MAG: ABC transporter permease [Anaerolineaceae bacterium]|nr:ABC transporter permease [Anaerolineaceae bacterium]MCY3936444.1 ABC transporter permease [Chloroflexota bacterium]
MIRHLRNFFSPMMALGIVLLALVLLPGLFGQLFTNPEQMRLMAGGINAAPTWDHLLGTQNEGRDVLTYILKGMPNTLLIGLVGGGSAVLLGTVLGMVAGYVGGPLDGAIRNIVDIGLTIPPLAILIMIAASFSVVLPLTMGLVIALTSWMHPTRVIRSQVLSLREREFVLLLRLSGASPLHIVFRELLPNLIPFLAATFVNSVATAILASIGLEVLGLGSFQTPTLGNLIYFAIIGNAMWLGLWWWWLPPILILIVLFMGLFFVSTALDAIANPRLEPR